MSQEITNIVIEENTIPECPVCSGREWRVHQSVRRNSILKKVDGFKDLMVQQPDEDTYQQGSLLMECVGCKNQFQPQAEVTAIVDIPNAPEYIEAYHENTESYLDFPVSVINQEPYE